MKNPEKIPGANSPQSAEIPSKTILESHAVNSEYKIRIIPSPVNNGNTYTRVEAKKAANLEIEIMDELG